MARAKELKDTVKSELARMLADTANEPSEGRMKLLKLGIAYLAVEAKLEESEFGDFFRDGDAGSVPPEAQPAARKRARRNGAAEPELEGFAET